jgi:hypothetical protein
MSASAVTMSAQARKNGSGITGWENLRHGGLLLDPQRLRKLAEHDPGPLNEPVEQELRRGTAAIQPEDGNLGDFVTFVLQLVCGFREAEGAWQRGTQIGAEWGRVAVTGEVVKPRQLWLGENGGVLPVFFDTEKKVGIGRGTKATSQIVRWLRSGKERLALLTNGRQWRLIFAGLDFDAWCEWDIDLWFEEGAASAQVQALRTLLSPRLWTPESEGAAAPFLQAVLDSRKGQADLSAVLGERVREAVEVLVQAHGEVLKERCSDVDPAEIYRAAVRVVMRMVVVLFAETRELLPRDNALYHRCYGLTGLIEELEKVAARGGQRLARSWNAWPRLLALFRLVEQGSHHVALPIPAYGGELFAPGDPTSDDGMSRALAVFETACFEREILPDRDVHKMCHLITRTKVKIRQGRTSTSIMAPVDFSDLSSEYIGILYEGLLDFELKTAPAGDPVIFLAVGNQPALPLSRLEGMDDKALANLLEKMKDTSKGEESGEGGEGEEDGEEEEGEENGEGEEDDVEQDELEREEHEGKHGDEDDEADEPDEHDDEVTKPLKLSLQDDGRNGTGGYRAARPATGALGKVAESAGTSAASTETAELEDEAEEPSDERHTTRTRAETWARRAVTVGKLVGKPRGALTPEKRLVHEDMVARKARQIVVRVILPGEWYLVRWGGTRKGAGGSRWTEIAQSRGFSPGLRRERRRRRSTWARSSCPAVPMTRSSSRG